MDKNISELTSGIAVSSRIRLARNIEGLPFPAKAQDLKEYDNLVNKVYSVIGKIAKFNVFKMSAITSAEKQALKERHLISNDLAKSSIGCAIINTDETISVMVNEEDHIRSQCIQKGLNLKSAYDVAGHIDDMLSEKLPIAFDSELGYLTSCPTNLGTGMRASVMMFLPALTLDGGISSIINALAKLGLTVRGVYGEGSTAMGYLYQISNQVSLGVTESDILKSVENAVIKICEAERHARFNLLENKKLDTEDMVCRAYGVLTNCVKISTEEFMKLISEVKLGAYLDIIKMKDRSAIDTIITNAQPANILLASGKELTALDRDVYRAGYVGRALKNLVV